MQSTAYPRDVGANVLLWLSYNLDAIRVLGLEAEDFPTEEQRTVYAWLSEMLEDGQRFEMGTEAWDRAYETGPKIHEAFAEVVDNVTANSMPLFDSPHPCAECGYAPDKINEMVTKARVLRRHRARMQVLAEMEALEVAAHSPDAFTAAMDKARQRVDDLTRVSEDRAPMMPSSIVAESDSSGMSVVDLGWPVLGRNMGGGLPRKDIIVLVGCPSVGKTAWCLNTIEHTLQNHPDEAVVFFSLEMPRVEVYRRHLMSYTKTTKDELRACMAGEMRWPYEDFTAIGFDRFAHRYKFYETDRTIKKMVRRLVGIGKVALVVVDYIQRMDRVGSASQSLVEKIEMNMHDLKSIAKSFDCGVIALSQIPRGKGEPWDPVTLRSAKGSSAIEEVADYMVGVWRPNFQAEQDTKQEICSLTLGLVKNRHDFVGRLEVAFDVTRQRITEGRAPERGGGIPL